MWKILKDIAKKNKRQLFLTFLLVAMENLMAILYPLFAGFAINAVVKGDVLYALSYAVVVFVMWTIGMLRRRVDTRVFTKIYAEMAVPMIINQRNKGNDASAVAARVALSREFVDFFELHLPIFITSLVSIVGALVMLLFLEIWVGVLGLFIMFILVLWIPRLAKINDKLYSKLNNRLENEEYLIEKNKIEHLEKHYKFTTKLRILISNREAFGYFCVGISATALFGLAFGIMATQGYESAGHIYSVTTYLWTFVISLDDMPSLMEQYSKLKDIGKRIENEE